MATDLTADAVRQLLAPLQDGAVAIDDAGEVVAVNDAALAALAPDRGRAAVHGGPADSLLGAARPAPGERVTLDARDGVYEATGSAVDAVEGVAVLVVLREVTARERRLERALELERVLRHALRDEMTGVLGRAEYVRDALEDAGVLPAAGDAADAVVDATRELADLGESARAIEETFREDGPETVPLDLVPVVEDVLAEAREDHPDLKIDANLPSTAVVDAPGSIERALCAVVEGACERNDAPVPRLDVVVSRDGDAVTVEVADNSAGVDDTARRMLEAGDEPPLRRDGGLERWLAHWVVDAAGGSITVGENVPRGAVVTVELPAAER